MSKYLIWWSIMITFVLGMCFGDLVSNIGKIEEETSITAKVETEEDIETPQKDYEIPLRKRQIIDIIKNYPIQIGEQKEVAPIIIEDEAKEEESKEDELIEKEIVWLPYLSTSYYGVNETGNKGELLENRNAVAMWQSDDDYLQNSKLCPMYREYFATHDGEEYGALPYGTKIEIRIWNQETKTYIYLGIYEVLDDSPTTQYNISDVAKNLEGKDGPLHFKYNWSNINYLGEKTWGGVKKGYIPNWKEEYSNKICGWIDVRKGYWGMAVIEIRIV